MKNYCIYTPLVGWQNSTVCLRAYRAIDAHHALLLAQTDLGTGIIYAGGRRFDGSNMTAIPAYGRVATAN
jgi:hypothetical protein